MQKHTKIYLAYFGYDTSDFIACEICGAPATEIHHIECRGMGGDPKGKKDVIENLMAICRKCHTEYGDITELEDYLKTIHLLKMKNNA